MSVMMRAIELAEREILVQYSQGLKRYYERVAGSAQTAGASPFGLDMHTEMPLDKVRAKAQQQLEKFDAEIGRHRAALQEVVDQFEKDYKELEVWATPIRASHRVSEAAK